MKEGLNIEQNIQTVQRLSPRQVQFVRLLEMTAPEIEEEVRRQLDDNPALEVVDPVSTEDMESQSDMIVEDPINKDPDDDPADYTPRGNSGGDDTYYARQIADDAPDLYSSLVNQLGVMEMPELTRKLATYIIGNIDENGYLTRALSAMTDDIAFSTGIDVTDKQMREAFDIVRSLDPPGVGAVDLRDCLLLQVNRMHPNTLTLREARDILTNYFDLLSKKHYDRLQAQLGILNKAEMQAAIELIRSLNPKPGSSIESSSTSLRLSQITPDVQVETADDGRTTVSIVSNLPHLQVESSFATDDSATDMANGSSAAMLKQARAFVKLKRDDAEAFISALQQRANTLVAVTEAIVRLQPDFFATGETSKLRSMILKDVSALTGLDISVISRATAGKYVATSSGVYPLKMFFNEAPKDDSEASSHQILHLIKQVVDSEDKRHPLSDEAIREALAQKGYNMARRTVTKYRERLGIPVGRLRRE